MLLKSNKKTSFSEFLLELIQELTYGGMGAAFSVTFSRLANRFISSYGITSQTFQLREVETSCAVAAFFT